MEHQKVVTLGEYRASNAHGITVRRLVYGTRYDYETADRPLERAAAWLAQRIRKQYVGRGGRAAPARLRLRSLRAPGTGDRRVARSACCIAFDYCLFTRRAHACAFVASYDPPAILPRPPTSRPPFRPDLEM